MAYDTIDEQAGAPSPFTDTAPSPSPSMPMDSSAPRPLENDAVEEPSDLERRTVAMWTARILKAKERWALDFARMRENISFAASYQWNGQSRMDDDRYICNVVLREINRKVASLYAKNPEAEFKRRPRRDFALWDEKMETLLQVGQRAVMNPYDMEAQAVISDYLSGMQRREEIDNVGDTLQKLYAWMIEQQEPEFKKQLKKLVRRVATCSVGYVKRVFERRSLAEDGEQDEPLTSSLDTSMPARAKRAQAIVKDMESGDMDHDDPRLVELRSLVASLGYSMTEGEQMEVNERVIYDFPRATSIIPDWRCQSLEDFEGARWVSQEYLLPLDEVNAFFGLDIENCEDLVTCGDDPDVIEVSMKGRNSDASDDVRKPNVMLWQVWDSTTKNTFFIVNGHPGFVVPPEPLTPCTKRFWPVFAITFNAIEYENHPDIKATIYPPSDVDLMKSAQKERNRSRDRLRDHRTANQPRWAAAEGVLDEESKEAIQSCQPHKVVEVDLPAGGKLSDVIYPMPTMPIVPELYDTSTVDQDILYATGAQQANLGPAQPDVTATVGSIAAQSAATESQSNVDDLDELLSDLAKDGGEVLLKEMSRDNVLRIVGRGAVWPSQPQDRMDYLNEIFLEVKAASTGRPNKALEMSNWQIIAPLLMQAGANPHFLVREGLRRYDDRIDPADAFPLVPQQSSPSPAAGAGAQRGMPQPGPGSQGVPQPGGMRAPMPVAGNPS